MNTIDLGREIRKEIDEFQRDDDDEPKREEYIITFQLSRNSWEYKNILDPRLKFAATMHLRRNSIMSYVMTSTGAQHVDATSVEVDKRWYLKNQVMPSIRNSLSYMGDSQKIDACLNGKEMVVDNTENDERVINFKELFRDYIKISDDCQ
jgi:DNA polymerase elongation subunit (family B)